MELTHCVKWLVITLYVLVHLDITVILSTIARKFQVRACYFLLYIDLVFLYYVINLEIVCECCNLHYIGRSINFSKVLSQFVFDIFSLGSITHYI